MDRKLALLPVLMALGCLISGAYGALHNQISYTVSPDYFHAFKFQQFAISPDHQNRLGASIVGWHASWWMGVIIGIPILLVGQVMPDWKRYLTRSLIAFGVVAVTALVAGLGALAWASQAITATGLPEGWNFPKGVVDRVGFARAGIMHDFSYLGGILGIFTGCAYLLIARLRLSKRDPAFQVSPQSIRATIGTVLIVVGPFFTDSAYLLASHWIEWLSGLTGALVALAASVSTGIYGISILPIGSVERLVLITVYVPIMLFVLFYYSLYFIGLVFGIYF